MMPWMILMKKYLEFIRLLRYFVDIQEPKVEEIHILLKRMQFSIS